MSFFAATLAPLNSQFVSASRKNSQARIGQNNKNNIQIKNQIKTNKKLNLVNGCARPAVKAQAGP